MERFRFHVGRSGLQARGVASLVSEDGRVRVTVLGEGREQESRVRGLVEHHARGRAPAPPALMPDIGYVVEELQEGRVLVIASGIALKQIFWRIADGELAVASEPRALWGHAGPGPSASLDPDVLYQYIYFHFVPGPASAYAGVGKLAAGHLLELHDGQARVERWWRPSFAVDEELTVETAGAQLRALLEGAVRRALSGAVRGGTFLSGGLDSSTVAGYAALAQPGIPTVSMGFDAEGYDEMHFARIAARRFGTTPLEYYVTPDDLLRTLPDIAAAFSEPFGNSSAAATYHCSRIAREQGLDTLLAGDGGDELFGGNERYATQLVFERYTRVPRPVRALLEPAVGAAAKITTSFPIGKAHSYIRQANTPLPDRLQEYNFLHRMPPGEVFDPDLLRHVDRARPLALLREEYGVPAVADAVDRMLFLDWRFTLHDNDLVKVNTMCELADVRVAYPMLDQSLVQFSLRLPSNWKVRGRELRWLYKQAMRGFLPGEIIGKSKHGFGLPFGTWTRTHAGLQRLAADALDSLARRRYFQPGFIASAQRLHREGHASYYGELVWILMVLELWLQKHMPRAGL